jgi:hypothetical protein
VIESGLAALIVAAILSTSSNCVIPSVSEICGFWLHFRFQTQVNKNLLIVRFCISAAHLLYLLCCPTLLNEVSHLLFYLYKTCSCILGYMQECENDPVVDSASYQVLTKLVFSLFKCLFINSNHCLLMLLPILYSIAYCNLLEIMLSNVFF